METTDFIAWPALFVALGRWGMDAILAIIHLSQDRADLRVTVANSWINPMGTNITIHVLAINMVNRGRRVIRIHSAALDLRNPPQTVRHPTWTYRNLPRTLEEKESHTVWVPWEDLMGANVNRFVGAWVQDAEDQKHYAPKRQFQRLVKRVLGEFQAERVDSRAEKGAEPGGGRD